jgi:hypothetical protein
MDWQLLVGGSLVPLRGRARTRRQMQARVGGAQTAHEVDALLDRYEATYPGCVIREQPRGGGLPTTIVPAPRRRAIEHTVASVSTKDGTAQIARSGTKSGAVSAVNTATVNTAGGNIDQGDNATRGDDTDEDLRRRLRALWTMSEDEAGGSGPGLSGGWRDEPRRCATCGRSLDDYRPQAVFCCGA